MKIYIVILEDHHQDLKIEPFTDIKKAMIQVNKWKNDYTDDWIEEEIKGWEYYTHSTYVDGPNIRILKRTLR